MTHYRLFGIAEPELSHLLKRVLRPGDWVIDGGANCGLFTIPMAQLVGPTGRVLAFEPGQNNLPFLEHNIRAGQFKNVAVVPAPLWGIAEPVTLHMHADGSKNALTPHPGTQGAESMLAVTLNSYATIEMTQHLRLVKLDIEGAEETVLRGGTDLLKYCSFVVAEANSEALAKFGHSIASLCDFMATQEYGTFVLHADDRFPTYIPPGVKITPYNAQARMLKLNFNLLFSTFVDVAMVWPEAICG